MDIKATDELFVAHTYARADVVITHGEGATLYGADGTSYIDFGSGIAVNTFGANDAVFNAAVTEQLSKVAHTSNLYYTEPCAVLARKLCERTGAGKVFFGNSGAEANECAIKVARKYSFDKYGAGRHKIVTLRSSFHGRTVTTLSATGQDVFHNYFFPFTEGFDYAEPNDYEDTVARLRDGACAFLFEVIQGEGGVNVLDTAYLRAVTEWCHAHDVLVLVDEVQTGNGRTGTLFAYEGVGIEPDVVTTAKGLGNGLPIGACLMYGRAQDVLTPGTHGSTFGGNPVVCAGAITVLDRLTGELLAEVTQKGRYVADRLAERGVSTSGKGLLIGVDVADAKAVCAACREQGLLVLTAKNRVRLAPPLNITYAELDRGIAILCNCIGG